jgi:hypothetical protein
MSILTDARAEALFASTCQPSEPLTAAEIRDAVQGAVRAYGVKGCACAVAAEFGDHPETAIARMAWARETVAATWAGRAR